MSWLARSIANTLRLDDDDEEKEIEFKRNFQNDVVSCAAASEAVDEDTSAYEEIDLEERSNNNNDYHSDDDDDDDQNRGVKEDLSELKETLTRQIWGVASFLAPPPSLHPGKSDLLGLDGDRIGQPELIAGSEVEEAENVGDGGGYFENSDFQDDEVEESEGDDAVGVTEEVLAFAANIAHHPETWLDFPLADEEEFDDFELSDAQQKHAYAVERLTPRLAALRFELCPVHLSEGFFWMVYFVLLYSRLNKHDAELLSTPQLVDARAIWMQELQKKTKPESDWFGIGTFQAKESTYSPRGDFESNSSEDAQSRYAVLPRAFAFESPTCHTTSDTETEKHSIENTEVQFIDKAVIEEDPPSKIIEKEMVAGPSFKPPIFDYDEHEDDWLKDNSELEGYTGSAVVNEEDVSFSDLEDDTDYTMPIKPKSVSIDYSPALNVS